MGPTHIGRKSGKGESAAPRGASKATGAAFTRITSAFTLVELLAVLSIVAALAGILLPVFAQAREKGRQAACLSHQRQLGMAILQYAQDNDERFPPGIHRSDTERVWPGQGWAGQCAPYIGAAGVLRCPQDPTPAHPPGDYAVSYGYNINLVVRPQGDEPPAGAPLASLSAPGRSVLLFEVSGVSASVTDPREGTEPRRRAGRHLSASANGLDNRLYAQRTWATRTENQYATGYLGGRLPFDPAATQFQQATGRHAGGSNFLLADGHARWLRGASVSSGLNAEAEHCNQDNEPPAAGCSGAFRAAGTASPLPAVAATFSIR